MKTYNVNSLGDLDLPLNGKVDHELWSKAEVLTDFVSPWDCDQEAKNIEFRALSNENKLFVSFKVYDKEIHTNNNDDSNCSINNSDRVELFLRSNKNLNPYYCLEIDPSSRLMDFKAYPNKVFDFNWKWCRNELMIRSSIQDSFFCVEVSITLNSLREKNLLKGNLMETGIFRAKYKKNVDGNMKPIWVSWVKPNTKTPNFHLPSSFGVLELC